MSKTIKNEDGSEEEVFTADEIEAQKQEAIEAYKLENPDKTDELIAIQEEKARIEEELKGLKDKDLNFANLRKQKEGAEKKIADILGEVDNKINSVKKEVLEGVMKDHYNDTIKALAGDDEELKKKIEFNYKRLADTVTTKSEMDSKLRDAWALSTKTEDNGVNANIFASGGVGRIKTKDSEKKFTQDEKEAGNKFGLSAKDFEKYGK